MKKVKNTIPGQNRVIIFIFIALAALMITSALIELQQSKKELFQLMKEQAHSLLESLIIASQNSLKTNEYLEDLYRERLLNNANFVKRLVDRGGVTNKELQKISRENEIYRINIFNKQGRKIFSSFNSGDQKIPAKKLFAPIFSDQADTMILGLRRARNQAGFRYSVAVASDDNKAIVLNIDARPLLDFKHNIGFGVLLRNVAKENSGIIYAALQDAENILAASGNITVLENIAESDFLSRSLRDSLFLTRVADFDSIQVFEAVHPFAFRGDVLGLLRLGISLKPVDEINSRIYRRLVIITLVLIAIGLLIFTFLFTRQRLSILKKQYEVVETYSGNIIDNVSEAIIVYEQDSGIKIFNSAAEELFNKKKEKALGGSLEQIFRESDCKKILTEDSGLHPLECFIEDRKKYLLVSKTHFFDSDKNENVIIVINDLTEQKEFEEQMERERRLSAMGELASGVAHEIRNPLNTIGTIIQQLDKDFEPREEGEEYHELAGLVYGEVKRINKTVQEFLSFARPEPVQARDFSLGKFIGQIGKQYQATLQNHNIKLLVDMQWDGQVKWDENQMKQALINIVQNAIEALEKNGEIKIKVKETSAREIEIRISDNGPGMPEETRKNIFNLYFTTKAQGTGIGMSIVQRIIFEHGGVITVDSEKGKGVVFSIRMPKEV